MMNTLTEGAALRATVRFVFLFYPKRRQGTEIKNILQCINFVL